MNAVARCGCTCEMTNGPERGRYRCDLDWPHEGYHVSGGFTWPTLIAVESPTAITYTLPEPQKKPVMVGEDVRNPALACVARRRRDCGSWVRRTVGARGVVLIVTARRLIALLAVSALAFAAAILAACDPEGWRD